MAYRSYQIASSDLVLRVVPDFGARVTELVDRRSNRNWLVPGPCSGSTGGNAKYGAVEACGWDECAPTVAPCPDPDWECDLRDHGDLWGRPWKAEIRQDGIDCVYSEERFTFSRSLTLQGRRLVCQYSMAATGTRTLPFMWSQHMLLATRPGEEIRFEGVGNWTEYGKVPATHTVQGTEASLVSKSYGSVSKRAKAWIEGKNGSIQLSWNASDAPFCGLWLAFGGWPDPKAPLHQMAIEPTSAPADDLSGARRLGHARFLKPGEEISWQIEVTVLPPENH